jgi:hypothetical protein
LKGSRKPVVYVILAILILGAFFGAFSYVPPTKKASAEYARAIFPLYVETFAGFFKGVNGNAPSGVANFPDKLGSLTVSGTAGASALTVNSVNIGVAADYGGMWTAIIDFGDGTYQILNATNVTANSADIYPTLSRTISSVNMGNMHEGVLGQHLSPLGYQTLATYVYNYDKQTAAKNRYVDIHGFAGTYYHDSSWDYGAEIGTPFSLTGGLTNGGYIGFLTKGIIDKNNRLVQNYNGKPWLGPDRTGYYSNGDVRMSIAGDTAGQGATKAATLGGKAAFSNPSLGWMDKAKMQHYPGEFGLNCQLMG